MLGFTLVYASKKGLTEIELMHMIRKVQLMLDGSESMSLAGQFYVLAGEIRTA